MIGNIVVPVVHCDLIVLQTLLPLLLGSMALSGNPPGWHIQYILSFYDGCVPRVRHAGAKMEAMLVGNSMEKRGVFQLWAWPMISRKRGCFQETTSMGVFFQKVTSMDQRVVKNQRIIRPITIGEK